MEFAFEKTTPKPTTSTPFFEEVLELIRLGMKAKEALAQLMNNDVENINNFNNSLSPEQKGLLFNTRVHYMTSTRLAACKLRILNGADSILELIESGVKLESAIKKVGKYRFSLSIYQEHMPASKKAEHIQASRHKAKQFEAHQYNEILKLVKEGNSISTACIKIGIKPQSFYNKASLGQRAEIKGLRRYRKIKTSHKTLELEKKDAPKEKGSKPVAPIADKIDYFNEMESKIPAIKRADTSIIKPINHPCMMTPSDIDKEKRYALKTAEAIAMLRLLINEARIKDSLSMPVDRLIDEIAEYVDSNISRQ